MRSERPDRLTKLVAGDLDTIVMRALQKDPKRRYASVDLFADDVRRHLAGLPVSARKDTLTYRMAKFTRRNRAAVLASAVVVLALIAGVVATAWQARIARVERARAERRFNDVRQLANSFLFEFHDAIAVLPGSTKAQELVVRQRCNTSTASRVNPAMTRHCNGSSRRPMKRSAWFRGR